MLSIPINTRRPLLLLNVKEDTELEGESISFEKLLEKSNTEIFHKYIYPLFLHDKDTVRIFTYGGTFGELKNKILKRKEDEFGYSFYGEKIIWHLNVQFYHINTKLQHPFSRLMLTPIEKKMEKALKDHSIPYRPQQRIGDYIVDFLVEINGKSIAVECDGADYHDIEKDLIRDKILWENHDIPTVRFTGSQILHNADSCVKQLLEKVEKGLVQVKHAYQVPEFFDHKQREAILHTKGPCRVLAPAGSGKTAVLIERITRLVHIGVEPDRILAITFTKKAGEEMRQRLEAKLGPIAKRIEIRTYHSLCHKYVAGERKKIDSPSKKVLQEVSKHTKRNVTKDLIDRIMEKAIRFEQLSKEEEKIKQMYLEALKETKSFTFDSLLVEFIEKLKKDEAFRHELQYRYEYLLVDESQDNNQAQEWITKVLGAPQDNIFWVGDDDQVIYSYQGASVESFLSIREHYPTIKSVFLEFNYRCHPQVVKYANNVIVSNNKRELKVIKPDPKKPYTDDAVEYLRFKNRSLEAKYIADYCEKKASAQHKVAILYRSKYYAPPIIQELRKRQLPFYIRDSIDLSDEKAIQTLQAYLAALNGMANEKQWEAVFRHGLKYIRNSQIETIRKASSIEEGVRQVIDHLPKNENFKKKEWENFLPQWNTLQQEIRKASTIEEQIQYLRSCLYLEDESITDEENEAIDAYLHIAKECNTLEELNNKLSTQSEGAEEKFNILLFTIHSSKGKQFDCVFLVGMNENVLPSKKSIQANQVEEERRVCYVGMTRAISKLYLTYNDESGEPSRFLEESKEPKMSCEVCAKSIPKTKEFTCSNCKAYTCPEHSLTCHSCGRRYCPDCSDTCQCKEFVCNHCKVVTNCCNQEICPDKKKQCSVCQTVLCDDHHSTCATCETSICMDHAKECDDCHTQHCPKHVEKCEWCNHQSCTRCYKIQICPGCKLPFCHHCMDTSGICEACRNRQTLAVEDILSKYDVPASLFRKNDAVEVGITANYLVYYRKKWFGLKTEAIRLKVKLKKD